MKRLGKLPLFALIVPSLSLAVPFQPETAQLENLWPEEAKPLCLAEKPTYVYRPLCEDASIQRQEEEFVDLKKMKRDLEEGKFYEE